MFCAETCKIQPLHFFYPNRKTRKPFGCNSGDAQVVSQPHLLFSSKSLVIPATASRLSLDVPIRCAWICWMQRSTTDTAAWKTGRILEFSHEVMWLGSIFGDFPESLFSANHIVYLYKTLYGEPFMILVTIVDFFPKKDQFIL